MLTLKDAETGHNYEVIKIHGQRRHEAPHHGYGPDQRNGPAYPPCVAPLGDPVEMTVRGL